jgi:hypothetical protein
LIYNEYGWTGEMLHPSGSRTIRAAYVVDARGRSSRNNPPRTWLGPATIALRGTWRGHANAVVRIGTGVSSWSWAAPIGDGRRVAIAFTNPRTLRRMGGSLRERYLRLLDEAGVSNPDLALEYEPQVCDATPFVREDASRKLLRTGEPMPLLILCLPAAYRLRSNPGSAPVRSSTPCSRLRRTTPPPRNTGTRADQRKRWRVGVGQRTDMQRLSNSIQPNFGVFGRSMRRRIPETSRRRRHCRSQIRH